MFIWFLLSLGTALAHSVFSALNNHFVLLGRFSKFTIVFWTTLAGSLILFGVSLFLGFPEIRSGFWTAILVTGIINSITAPMILKAYELGEFSSVFSMILLSPVFLLITGFLFLGEVPSLVGVFGVTLTVFGLVVITNSAKNSDAEVYVSKSGKINRGNLFAILVALLWSISVNFDKLAAGYSSPFFAPAVSMGIIAVLSGVYLIFIKRNNLSDSLKSWKFSSQLIILPLGAILALSNIFFNAALLAGLASYTVVVKRLAVVFGIFWGWIFFHEKNIGKKLLGAAIAIIGVIAIFFS